jgi:predicted TIM-barrel fold metal-dependent hydrolase
MHACFWFEQAGVAEALQVLGDTNVMFETDFPHPTCLYPDSLPAAATAIRTLPAESRRRIMGDNAARLYKLPRP